MRAILLPALALLASCASWDDEVASCRELEEGAARRACLERVLGDDQAQRDNDGIGPPSCHPASTRPNPDRDPC
jgi:hypothetical protein